MGYYCTTLHYALNLMHFVSDATYCTHTWYTTDFSLSTTTCSLLQVHNISIQSMLHLKLDLANVIRLPQIEFYFDFHQLFHKNMTYSTLLRFQHFHLPLSLDYQVHSNCLYHENDWFASSIY